MRSQFLIKRANRPQVCARDLSKPWDHMLRIWFLYAVGLAIGISKHWRALIFRNFFG